MSGLFNSAFSLFGALSLAGIIGCSVMRADPAPDSGFVEHPERMAEQANRYPFNAVWVSEEYKAKRDSFDKIVISRVDTTHVEKTGNWDHINIKSEEQIKTDIQMIANDLESAFKKAFEKPDNNKVILSDSDGPQTLVLETALVELVPTDIVRNAAGDIAGFFVPGGGLVSAGAGGSVAIEGRFRDGETKEILWTFKDREIDQVAPIDLAGLTPYRHVENNIDEWADELVELLNSPMDHKVTHASPITLSPW